MCSPCNTLSARLKTMTTMNPFCDRLGDGVLTRTTRSTSHVEPLSIVLIFGRAPSQKQTCRLRLKLLALEPETIRRPIRAKCRIYLYFLDAPSPRHDRKTLAIESIRFDRTSGPKAVVGIDQISCFLPSSTESRVNFEMHGA